jgi:hypothetical protein
MDFEIANWLVWTPECPILFNFMTMRKIIGLSIIVISFFGFLFFQHYRGDLIVHPFLWFLIFFLLGYVGLIVAKYGVDRDKKMAGHTAETEIEKFKARAQKIDLDLNACEFKESSFSHEVQDPNVSSVGLIPLHIARFAESAISEDVESSCLVYTRMVNGKPEKYVSQPFPFDATTLEYHVMNKDLVLYIENTEQGKFLFDLKK